MAEKNSLIHIKLESEEAVTSRTAILSSQIILLKILKKVSEYKDYRAKEFELKSQMYNKIRELRITIGNLEKVLPKLKLPKTLKKQEEKKEPQYAPQKKKTPYDFNIETQLQEIQRKLDALQRR